MSASSEPQQCQFCPRFSKGQLCRQKNCKFLHKWSVYNAAKKEKKLAGLSGNRGDFKNGSLFLKQGSKDVQKTNSVNNALNAVEDRDTTTLPSGKHSDGIGVESSFFHPLSLRQKADHSKPRYMATSSMDFYQRNSRRPKQSRPKWAKPSNGRDSCVAVPGSRTTEEAGGQTGWDSMSEYVVESSCFSAPCNGREICQYGSLANSAFEVFTLFSELPFELRAEIWNFAIRSTAYNPRVRLEPVFDHKGQISYYSVICRTKTPVLFRVCHESRREALKYYSLSFGQSTFLNKSAGVLYLDSYRKGEFVDFTEAVPLRKLETIENLAVKLTEWSSLSTSFRTAISKLTSLKTLVFMLNKEDDDYYSDKAAIKMIRKDLMIPKTENGDSRKLLIILVPSHEIEAFLSRETF